MTDEERVRQAGLMAVSVLSDAGATAVFIGKVAERLLSEDAGGLESLQLELPLITDCADAFALYRACWEALEGQGPNELLN